MNRLLRFPSTFVLPAVLALGFFSACSSNEEPEKPAHTAVEGPSSPGPRQEPVAGQSYTTASGLEYLVLEAGTGPRPKSKYDQVRVHYHGYLLNGTIFDSSIERGLPIVFSLHEVIPGWTEGVLLMREGSKYRFRIPHYLAYGEAGSPPKIGPRETLMFEIELLEVIN